MIVTNIKKTKRGMNAIYIDGEYRTYVDDETLFKSKLKIGSLVDESLIEDIILQSEERKAKEKAFKFISYRSHSKRELRDKIKRSVSEQSADVAVEKMESLGLVDDLSFSLMYAKDMFFRKKYAINRVRYELARKGIDKNIIDETISKINPDEKAQVLELINGKYCGKFNDEKGKKRVIASLQRLGYKWEDIKSVFYEVCEHMVEDDF